MTCRGQNACYRVWYSVHFCARFLKNLGVPKNCIFSIKVKKNRIFSIFNDFIRFITPKPQNYRFLTPKPQNYRFLTPKPQNYRFLTHFTGFKMRKTPFLDPQKPPFRTPQFSGVAALKWSFLALGPPFWTPQNTPF